MSIFKLQLLEMVNSSTNETRGGTKKKFMNTNSEYIRVLTVSYIKVKVCNAYAAVKI